MDQTRYEEDNTKNCLLESEVPDLCKTEPCWLGIDEAGRGPVLGPMVYGTCYSPLSKKEELKNLGFADSKTLTEEQREKIFEMLNENGHLIGWMVDILSPTYISNSMLKRAKYNLNALSHDCAISLIEKVLGKGVNVAEIYVDTVGDPAKYQDKLKKLFPNIDITVAKKADADYQIVGAASICAKVARDKAVKNWKFIEGIEVENNYGSGYPSDPATKKFMSESLDKVFGFPQFVRVSWSTASNIIDKKAVTFRCQGGDAAVLITSSESSHFLPTRLKKNILDQTREDDEEENENTKNTQSLFKFMGKKDERTNRHKFFRDRCLNNVAEL